MWCPTLPKCSLGLIADTGIVLDILARHPARTLHDAVFEWGADVVGKIEPAPSGRSITMFVSAGVYRDYKARLGRAGISTPSSYWQSMRKRKFASVINRPRRLIFMIDVVRTNDENAALWPGDRYDRAFFALLAAVGGGSAWSDRQIIFASRDRDASSRMRDMAVRLGHGGRVHFADSLRSCEELILC